MSTYCLILRNNRTMGRMKVKDKADDFDFEGGLYFIRREKVFLWKTSIRGKIRPTLLYIEGIADPLYLDNLSIKEYTKMVPELDKDKKPILDEKTGQPKLIKKVVRELQDIFIDARAIHNLTDRKILAVLSAQASITPTEIILMVLVVIGIIIGIVSIFI